MTPTHEASLRSQLLISPRDNYTMVKVRLFCWWCCVCCIVLLTLCIFYEPAMTTAVNQP